MLRYLMIGHDYIALLLQLLAAQLIIEVCSKMVLTAVVRPRSGVRPEDRLSPALFSTLTLALVYDVSRLHANIEILLYADDILLLFRGRGRRAVGNVEAVLYVLGIFGHYSKLTINRGRSYALVKTRSRECPTHIAGLPGVLQMTGARTHSKGRKNEPCHLQQGAPPTPSHDGRLPPRPLLALARAAAPRERRIEQWGSNPGPAALKVQGASTGAHGAAPMLGHNNHIAGTTIKPSSA